VRAVASFGEAASLAESSFGPLSPFTKTALRSLAWNQARSGRPLEALSTFARMEAIEERQLEAFLGSVSELRQRAFLEDAHTSLDYLVAFQQGWLARSDAARRLVLEAILRRKARAFDVTGAQLESARMASVGASGESLKALRTLQSDLATLVLRGPGDLSIEQYRQRIAQMRDAQEELEDRLAAQASVPAAVPVSVESVIAALPPRTALLEFVRYASPAAGSRPRYALYAVKGGGRDVEAVDLGEAERIERRVDLLRANLGRPGGDVLGLARELDQALLQPLGSFLVGVDRLRIAPDGALHLLPFGALADERGVFRVKTLEISYLGSGRELLRAGRRTDRPDEVSSSFVLGAPEFDRAASSANASVSTPPPTDLASTRSRELRKQRFGALPATLREARTVAGVLGTAAVLGADASEVRLKAVQRPRILHLATHAFFLRDLPRAAQAGSTRSLPSMAGLENPLLRSGLALAGANRRGSSGEDGILTALEAATLNLSGTELVVLSACDTGLGQVDRGEGVLGLRRAFALAGARSLLMSLWSVNDAATSQLMQAYYGRLKRGEGRSDALRGVQLEFLADPVLADPYYWAPFILAGDGAPIAGL
jgi:CHAT domain-containing protein